MIKDTVAPVKEAVATVKKVEEVKSQAKQGVETIKETGGKVVDALNHVGDKAKENVAGFGTGIQDVFQKRAEAKEKAEREAMEAHAAMRGFKIDPSWTMPRLRLEMQKAEAEWQAVNGPNAKCPNRKCNMVFRFKPTQKGERRCLKCGTIFTVQQALAHGRREPVYPTGKGSGR